MPIPSNLCKNSENGCSFQFNSIEEKLRHEENCPFEKKSNISNSL